MRIYMNVFVKHREHIIHVYLATDSRHMLRYITELAQGVQAGRDPMDNGTQDPRPAWAHRPWGRVAARVSRGAPRRTDAGELVERQLESEWPTTLHVHAQRPPLLQTDRCRPFLLRLLRHVFRSAVLSQLHRRSSYVSEACLKSHRAGSTTPAHSGAQIATLSHGVRHEQHDQLLVALSQHLLRGQRMRRGQARVARWSELLQCPIGAAAH